MADLGRESKPCRRHNEFFPDEDPVRSLDEFASAGKHSYCKRCMKFISAAYNKKRAEMGEVPTPRAQKVSTADVPPLKKPIAPRKPRDTNWNLIRNRPPETLKDSPLGRDPSIDTPFLINEDEAHVLYAFKNFWLCGDNVSILGCLWSERGNWKTELKVFRLSGIHVATSEELRVAGVVLEGVPA